MPERESLWNLLRQVDPLFWIVALLVAVVLLCRILS